MAEINLLQNDSSTTAQLVGRGGYYVSRLLMVVLVAVVAWYAYLMFDGRKTASDIEKTQAKITQAETEALAAKGRGEVLTRQGQVKELDGLIKNHLYWSYLLPEIARVTLNTAKYTAVEADSTGKLTLSVAVATYEDFEKIMQIFDLPEYNQQFSNVTVLSINKAQHENEVETIVRIQLTFNPMFIKGKL